MQGSWQVDGKSRAEVHFRFDGDQAVVTFNDRIGGSQAKAVAFGFGREVGIKNAFKILLWYADAFVTHADANVIAGREIRHVGRGRGGVAEVVAAHPQRSAVWHRLVGVHDEVRNHLTDLAGINFSWPEVGAELDGRFRVSLDSLGNAQAGQVGEQHQDQGGRGDAAPQRMQTESGHASSGDLKELAHRAAFRGQRPHGAGAAGKRIRSGRAEGRTSGRLESRRYPRQALRGT